jgi:hypothetical protein
VSTGGKMAGNPTLSEIGNQLMESGNMILEYYGEAYDRGIMTNNLVEDMLLAGTKIDYSDIDAILEQKRTYVAHPKVVLV